MFARVRADLECSYTLSDIWLKHQRLELETDLIGAYVQEHIEVPAAQFIG